MCLLQLHCDVTAREVKEQKETNVNANAIKLRPRRNAVITANARIRDSCNINEVIKAVLNYLFILLLRNDFTRTKSTKKHLKARKGTKTVRQKH